MALTDVKDAQIRRGPNEKQLMFSLHDEESPNDVVFHTDQGEFRCRIVGLTRYDYRFAVNGVWPGVWRFTAVMTEDRPGGGIPFWYTIRGVYYAHDRKGTLSVVCKTDDLQDTHNLLGA